MRRPTIEEAVNHIIDSQTVKYQCECIQYWREKYGDDFAESVRRAVKNVQKMRGTQASRKRLKKTAQG